MRAFLPQTLALALLMPFAASAAETSQTPADAVPQVTVSFQGVDLQEALYRVFLGTNLRCEAPRDVPGTFSMNVANVSLDQALKGLLEPRGLTFSRDGQVYRVARKADFQTAAERLARENEEHLRRYQAQLNLRPRRAPEGPTAHFLQLPPQYGGTPSYGGGPLNGVSYSHTGSNTSLFFPSGNSVFFPQGTSTFFGPRMPANSTYLPGGAYGPTATFGNWTVNAPGMRINSPGAKGGPRTLGIGPLQLPIPDGFNFLPGGGWEYAVPAQGETTLSTPSGPITVPTVGGGGLVIRKKPQR